MSAPASTEYMAFMMSVSMCVSVCVCVSGA